MAHLPRGPESTAMWKEALKAPPKPSGTGKKKTRKKLSDFEVAFSEARREAVKRGADPRKTQFRWRGRTFTTRYKEESLIKPKAKSPGAKPPPTQTQAAKPAPKPVVTAPKAAAAPVAAPVTRGGGFGKGVAVGFAAGAAAGAGAAYGMSRLRRKATARTMAGIKKAVPKQLPAPPKQLTAGPKMLTAGPRLLAAGAPRIATEEFGPSLSKWRQMSQAQRRKAVGQAAKRAGVKPPTRPSARKPITKGTPIAQPKETPKAPVTKPTKVTKPSPKMAPKPPKAKAPVGAKPRWGLVMDGKMSSEEYNKKLSEYYAKGGKAPKPVAKPKAAPAPKAVAPKPKAPKKAKAPAVKPIAKAGATTRRVSLARKAAKIARDPGAMSEAEQIVRQADKELAARGIKIPKPLRPQTHQYGSTARFRPEHEISARRQMVESFMRRNPKKVTKLPPVTLKDLTKEAVTLGKKTLVKKTKVIVRKAKKAGKVGGRVGKVLKGLGPIGILLGGIEEARRAKRPQRGGT